jgi:hypothetical protein
VLSGDTVVTKPATAEVIPIQVVDDERDDAILDDRVRGKSIRDIARDRGMQEHEVKSILDRLLKPYTDDRLKLQQIGLARLRFDRAYKMLMPKVEAGDITAANSLRHLQETDALTTGWMPSAKFELQALVAAKREHSMAAFQRGLELLCGKPVNPAGEVPIDSASECTSKPETDKDDKQDQ